MGYRFLRQRENNKYFYAAYGLNGTGVFTDYYDCLDARHTLVAHKCKKFKTLEEARKYAMDMYNESWINHPDYQIIYPEEIPVNDLLLPLVVL